jgi:hypothetical protein
VTAWVLPLVTLVTGAVVSGVATYLGTRTQWRLTYDSDLRQRRIKAYSDLWARLQPLARYQRPTTLSGKEITALAASLRQWYFTRGGIFLSVDTRTDYFAVQDALELVDSGWGWESPERTSLTPAAWELVRVYGSRLRTSLTLDVGTRSRPRMPTQTEPLDKGLAGRYQREDGALLTLRLPRRLPALLRPGSRPWLLTSPDGQRKWEVPVLRWSAARGSVRVQMISTTTGDLADREIWFEPERLIEGPALHARQGDPAVLWTRADPPPSDG